MAETIPIEKARKEQVEIVAENDLSALLNKGAEKDVRIEIVLDENIKAPLEYYEKVGVERCYLGDELIGEINLVANEKVEAKKYLDFFSEVFGCGYRLGR